MKSIKIATSQAELKRELKKRPHDFLVWAYTNGLEIRQIDTRNGMAHNIHTDYFVPRQIAFQLYGRNNYDMNQVYRAELPAEYYALGEIDTVAIYPENTTQSRLDQHDMLLETTITVGKHQFTLSDLLVVGRLSTPNVSGYGNFDRYGYSHRPMNIDTSAAGPIVKPVDCMVLDQ